MLVGTINSIFVVINEDSSVGSFSSTYSSTSKSNKVHFNPVEDLQTFNVKINESTTTDTIHPAHTCNTSHSMNNRTPTLELVECTNNQHDIHDDTIYLLETPRGLRATRRGHNVAYSFSDSNYI